MNSPTDLGEQAFEAATSQLSAGLRTCRTVVSNYRSLLVGEEDAEPGQARFTESAESTDDWGQSGFTDSTWDDEAAGG